MNCDFVLNPVQYLLRIVVEVPSMHIIMWYSVVLRGPGTHCRISEQQDLELQLSESRFQKNTLE